MKEKKLSGEKEEVFSRRGSAKHSSGISNQQLKDLLPMVLQEIECRRNDRPDLILESWNSLVEEKWRPYTQAISFEKGVLVVKVKNAALYSLLVQQERERLLRRLQEKFPQVELKNIVFRIG